MEERSSIVIKETRRSLEIGLGRTVLLLMSLNRQSFAKVTFSIVDIYSLKTRHLRQHETLPLSRKTRRRSAASLLTSTTVSPRQIQIAVVKSEVEETSI